MHETINSLQDFVETFLLHFSEGLNGEYATNNVEMFRKIAEVVNNEISHSVEIGGHATVWAVQAQMEHCAVYNTPSPNERIIEGLRRNDFYWQPEGLTELEDPIYEESDEHLVLEYKQGDSILGYTAPRSNRFYFVNDPVGGSFQMLEPYHRFLDSVDRKPYRHMFGGF